MSVFSYSFIESYIFGNSLDKKWYKFDKFITKEIKKDIKEVKRNKEVSNDSLSSKAKKVIIKGKNTIFWRVYIVSCENSVVIFPDVNGNITIKEIYTFSDNINHLWLPWGDCSWRTHYTHLSLGYKVIFNKFVYEWIKDNIDEINKIDSKYPILKDNIEN